jgi:hypothetical protein
MASFSLNLRTNASLFVDGEPSDYISHHHGEVVCTDDMTGGEAVAGHVHAMRIQAGLAWQRGESLFDVCDSHSQEMHVIHTLFYKPDGYELKERFALRYDAFDPDILVLDYILIEPKWRGLKLGLLVARKLIDLLAGGCGLVVSEIAPLRREAHRELGVPAKWIPKGATKENRRAALKDVRAYFRQVGFERLGRSPYYFLSTAMKLPSAGDLLKPESSDEN